MIGYSVESKTYRLFDIETLKVIVSRDFKFNEHVIMSSEVKKCWKRQTSKAK